MGFFDDIGDFGKALFTGRWTGGQDSVGDVWNRDPMAVLAPLGILATGGLGLAGIGPAAGLGAAFGTAEAAGGAGIGLAGAEIGGGLGAAEVGGGLTGEALSVAGVGEAGLGAEATGSLAGLSQAAPGLDTLAGAAPETLPGAAAAGSPAGLPMQADALGAAGAPDSSSFLGDFGSSLKNAVMKNPLQSLGVGVAGAGLGMNLLRGNPDGPNKQALQQMSQQQRMMGQSLTAEGQQLTSYLTSGTLPPGQQAQVTQAVRAAKARIIANQAKNGMSTDPRQNSALGQELAQADASGIEMAGKIEMMLAQQGNQLIQAGLNETGLSVNMYEALMKYDQDTNKQVSQALANFAAALAGGSGKKAA